MYCWKSYLSFLLLSTQDALSQFFLIVHWYAFLFERALEDDGVVAQHIMTGCHWVASMKKGDYFGLYIDASVWDGWWGGLVGLANLDKSGAVDTFLEVIGCITKVLCSLLLRTCSKDIGAMRSGQTTFGGETGPTLASQGHGDTIKQSFCDPMHSSCCNTGIRQVKPSYW